MSPSLPTSHPLILELSSLRGQLAQYQHSSHTSQIQLQGSRLETTILKDQNASLSSTLSALQAELDILRQHPSAPLLKPDSTTLAELSLAHRRLSAKLDITEGSLSATKLELAAARQEISRLGREREGDRAAINEFRRVEEEREEELVWERGERRKAEEQKKLRYVPCLSLADGSDLALKEYSTLVHTLDPAALPSDAPAPLILSSPSLNQDQSPDTTPHDPRESISNLLQGQQGVHRLVDDFVALMTAKEKEITRMSSRVDELELSLSSVTKQLEEETALRVECLEQRDQVLRDDLSASRVVERYMSFTQKTHATIHMHLDNLRARSTATQASLRKENMEYQARLALEVQRGARLRGAVEEMAEGLSRETAGRRREVALRLKMIAAEEKRERKVEIWLDRVRRAREGAEGAVLEPDALEGLVDEGVEAVAEDRMDVGREKRQAWRGLLGRKRAASFAAVDRESSVARVLLAEELVNTLVQDLQVETERRIDLEKQRVLLLAKEAASGEIVKEDGDDLLVFDVDKEEEPAVETTPIPLPSPDPTPQVDGLKSLFEPMRQRYNPLQSSLHSLGHSLSSLRQSLPEPTIPISPVISTRPGRKPLLTLNLRRPAPLADPVLLTILDNIHEVLEDARVDVEIALADEERVYRGFEALLNVGKGGMVHSGEVISDAEEYVQDRSAGETSTKLQTRVADIEADLSLLKEKIMEYQGAGAPEDAEEEPKKASKSRSVWTDIPLKTVSPIHARTTSPLGTPTDSPGASPRQNPMAVMGNMGRSFSASIVGAPRKVSGFAGGLYRPKKREEVMAERQGLVQTRADDDVE